MTAEPLFTRRRIVVLAVCVGIFALGQFHRASGAVFSPILMERFDASAATIGGLVSAMFLATVIAQAPFGILLDKFGPRYVIAGCMSVIAAGAALFAIGETFNTLLISRVMIGVGAASMGAASHVIIGRTFPKRDFGYISGLVVTIGGVGGILGSFPLSVALERLPWGWVFGTVSMLTVGLTVAILTAIRGEGPAPKPAEGGASGGYITLLKSAEFRKILAMAIVTWAPITAISGLWGGPYLQDALGMAAEPAGAVLSLMFVMTLSAGYIFGALDRRMLSRRRLIFIGAGMSMSSLLRACRPASAKPGHRGRATVADDVLSAILHPAFRAYAQDLARSHAGARIDLADTGCGRRHPGAAGGDWRRAGSGRSFWPERDRPVPRRLGVHGRPDPACVTDLCDGERCG